jgi:uncharacterized membrane protein
MRLLITGLVVFLGAHSVRIVAEEWRAEMIGRVGLNVWKGLYSLVSLAGFALVVWGYGRARVGAIELWHTPGWLHYPAWLLMLLSFVLLAAVYVPRNRIKTALGHPMIAGVTVWALAHLLTNARAADVMLFGSFLVWSVIAFHSAGRRERAAGTSEPAGTWANAAVAVAIGLAVWILFIGYLHSRLIGVSVI